MRRKSPGSASAGFTLIELLAVLVIISLLAAFLVVALGGARETVKAKNTGSHLHSIGTALSEHDSEIGDFARSEFPTEWGAPPNNTNLGAECLYLTLCAEGGEGFGVFDKPEQLVNTDGDSLSKRLKGFEKSDLFELADDWENPIAYLHHRDYEREYLYVTQDPETGKEIQSTVRALKNEKTGRWFEPQGFQLISAGPDGEFGTEDDITNFKKP